MATTNVAWEKPVNPTQYIGPTLKTPTGSIYTWSGTSYVKQGTNTGTTSVAPVSNTGTSSGTTVKPPTTTQDIIKDPVTGNQYSRTNPTGTYQPYTPTTSSPPTSTTPQPGTTTGLLQSLSGLSQSLSGLNPKQELPANVASQWETIKSGVNQLYPANPEQPPTVNGPQPNLPTGEDMNAYTQNATTEIQGIRTDLEKAYTEQLKLAQEQADAAQKKIDEYTSKTEGALGDIQNLTQPFAADLEAAERKRLLIEDNYFANQKAIGELETMMNQMVSEYNAAKSETGLGVIRLPRLAQIKQDYEARVGVIKAVMAARNEQISVGENLIDRSVNAILTDKNLQLNYYNQVLDFYNNQMKYAYADKSEATSTVKDYAMKQIALIENDYTRLQDTADYIKNLMINPATASLMQDAGVNLNMSVQQINQALAKQSGINDAKDQSNKMLSQGYREIDANTFALKPSYETTSYVDANGTTHYFWQASKPSSTDTKTTIGTTAGFGSYDVETDVREFIGDKIDSGVTDEAILFRGARGRYSQAETTDEAIRQVVRESLGLGTPVAEEESTGESSLPGEVSGGFGSWWNPAGWVSGIGNLGGRIMGE